MGVLGLWQLLQPTGHPVNLESLTGKTLAVDVSMWMHQSSKGLRDRHGNPVPNAHLVGLFRRICKLLFYHVKPIVVFDGGAPILKRQTLANRRQHREEATSNSNRSNKKLMSKLLKYHAIGSAVGTSSVPSASSPSKSVLGTAAPKQDDQDLFQLPPIPTLAPDGDSHSGDEDKQVVDGQVWEEVVERRSRYYEQMKELHKHNIDSESFEALPLDVKHEILSDLKDSNKRTDWATISSIPKDSNDFSSFQLNRLIQQNKLSQLLENVRQEMNYSAGGLESIVEVADGATVESNRVMSDDTAQYVLIKGCANPESLATVSETTEVVDDAENSEDSQQVSLLSSQKVFRMNDSFAIRKIAKDKNAGRKFAAPVSEVKLSSSSSSSSEEEEVIRRPKKNATPVSSALPRLPCLSATPTPVNVTGMKISTHSLPAATGALEGFQDLDSKQPISAATGALEGFQVLDSKQPISAATGALEGFQVLDSKQPISAATGAMEGSRRLDSLSKVCEQTTTRKVVSHIEIQSIETLSQTTDNLSELSAPGPVKERGMLLKEKNAETGEECFVKPAKQSDVQAITVILDPTKMPNNDLFDDLFPSSVFVVESTKRDKSTTSGSPERNLAADLNELDVVPDFNCDEADDASGDNDNPFIGLSKEGLVEMQRDLVVEAKELQSERGKQERLASGITNQMHADAQELLQLFGVPFLVSPMEAEAQCAYLDYTDQTHGTVTDDSDVWLFGGRRVYKNLFNQGRDVELYSIEDIESDLALDRNLLINIALLCGSDYTEGIPGIGPVTALELLAEFHGEGLEKLLNFAEWWRENKGTVVKQTRLKSRLLQLQIREGFPSRTVVEAYLHPTVDDSKEAFSWGEPNIDGLREFARTKLSWGRGQTDELLLPLMKRRGKAIQVQTQVTSYFCNEQRTAVSKRLKHVVERLRAGVPETVSTKKKRKQIKRQRTRRKPSSSSSGGASNSDSSPDDNDDNDGGFIRKRPTGRRIITSDDEQTNDSNEVSNDISDSEMALIDIDNVTSFTGVSH